MDGTDGLDGALVRLGWDGRPLAPARTGVPEQERHHWLLRGRDALAGYCKQGTNGTGGLDGALVGRGWDRRTLEPSGTGAPPWAPEQKRPRWILMVGALCKVVSGTNCVGLSEKQNNTNRVHTNPNL